MHRRWGQEHERVHTRNLLCDLAGRNWLRTWKAALAARSPRKSTTKNEKKRAVLENYFLKNEFVAFLRAKQSSIARDFERELKAASRGTVRSLAMFHRVCKEGGKLQACTNCHFCLASWFVYLHFVKLEKLARFRSPRSLEQIVQFVHFLHSFEKKNAGFSLKSWWGSVFNSPLLEK